MRISFASPGLPESGALVTGCFEDRKLAPVAVELDKKTDGALKRAMASSRFTGRRGETLEIVAPAKLKNSRILLVGLGDIDFAGNTPLPPVRCTAGTPRAL